MKGSVIRVNQQYNNLNAKKKKYWLIPVCVFLMMILAPLINITLKLLNFNSSISGSISTVIYVICGLLFIPSIIIAVILSHKDN